MRVLVQRVSRAEVRVLGGASPSPASIGKGLVVLLGVGQKDDDAAARRLAEKTANLRIFSNEQGKFDHSLLDVRGEALVVSQFTLYGNCARGRRPDFTAAMPPERAAVLYEAFVAALRGLGLPVKTGEFRAEMEVELVNDGPVTLWIDSEEV